MQRRRDREREKERGDGRTDGRTALTDHNESMNARARSIVSRVESSSFPYSFHIQRSCVRTPNSVLIVMFRHATFIQEGTKLAQLDTLKVDSVTDRVKNLVDIYEKIL